MLETKSHTFSLPLEILTLYTFVLCFLHFTWEYPPARFARQPPNTTPARRSPAPAPFHYIDAHYYVHFQKLAPIIESKQ